MDRDNLEKRLTDRIDSEIRREAELKRGLVRRDMGREANIAILANDICKENQAEVNRAVTEAEEKLLEERDNLEEQLDEMAQAISDFFGEEIGEHSNINHPWLNAIEIIERHDSIDAIKARYGQEG